MDHEIFNILDRTYGIHSYRLIKAAQSIKHCGDWGKLFINPRLKKIIWCPGDADVPPLYDSETIIIKKLKKAVPDFKIIIDEEGGEFHDNGWQEIKYENFKLNEQKALPKTYQGKSAAGVLVYCFTTNRFLLLKRSGISSEAGTYALISGVIENGETPLQGLQREIEEETNRLDNIIIYPEPFYIFRDKNFVFYNFFGITKNEFTPKIDEENTGYQWVKLDQFTRLNLHFGIRMILNHLFELFALIQKYS